MAEAEQAKADQTAQAKTANPKKKSKLVLIVTMLLLGVGGGGAWYFMNSEERTDAASTNAPTETEASKSSKPPVFVPIETFTVNLQSEGEDQFLQVGLSLKVIDSDTEEAIKKNMPEIRSNILLLLSSKKASDLNHTDGKKKLSGEILNVVNQIIGPSQKNTTKKSENEEEENKSPQKNESQVLSVLFNSFIIQ